MKKRRISKMKYWINRHADLCEFKPCEIEIDEDKLKENK